MTQPGLGRLQAPDSNDARFLMAATLPREATERRYRYWSDGRWFGDQGATSRCVEFGWHHWVQTGPVKPKGAAPYWEVGSVYAAAQRDDEWPGEDYDGTSVRAGAKVLQALGYISTYLWAWDVNTVVDTVLTTGPVVVGTNWYDDMFSPNKNGIVTPTGPLRGGHAYVITGVSKNTGLLRFKNSWGRGWGLGGRFRMAIEDFEKILLEEGEACLAVENRV